MTIYLLYRHLVGEEFDYEYDPVDFVWTDIDSLYAYIANKLGTTENNLVITESGDAPKTIHVKPRKRRDGIAGYYIVELESLP